MTNSIFLTGDRMMALPYPGQVMLELLRAVNEGKQIMTGTNDGIEALTRAFCEQAGVPVIVVEQMPLQTPENPGHWIDWDKRHLSLPEDCEIVSIHVDHHTCRVTMSALNVRGDDVRLVTLADMLPTADA